MDKKYISIDIEASGSTPGMFSMLSLGACIVGAVEQQFYIEFKPISSQYILEAMQKGCLGLRCLESLKGQEVYNPKSPHFRPDLVLDILARDGVLPDPGMREFREWILDSTKGFEPRTIARPIVFDGSFINWYFDNFVGIDKNPLGHSGENLNCLYRGLERSMQVNVNRLLPPAGLSHNALEDAIAQARVAEYVLGQMDR